VRQWLDYTFGKRDKPLATPEASLDASGGDLVFDITAQDTDERLRRAEAAFYAATRVDSTPSQIDDFKAYSASRTGSRFRARIAATERSSSGELLRADNVIYFATLTDPQGLPVSSVVYMGGRIDLSTDFQPTIGPFPGSTVSAPVPPPRVDAAYSLVSVAPVQSATFEGLAVSNSGADPITVRVEASTTAGASPRPSAVFDPRVLRHRRRRRPGRHPTHPGRHAQITTLYNQAQVVRIQPRAASDPQPGPRTGHLSDTGGAYVSWQ